MKNIISFFPEETLLGVKKMFKNNASMGISGAGSSSSKAMIIASILGNQKMETTIWVVNTKSEINILKQLLEIWGDQPVFKYSKLENEDRVNYGSYDEFKNERIKKDTKFLHRVLSKDRKIIITDLNSILEDFPNTSLIQKNKTNIEKGQRLNIVNLIDFLVKNGYSISEEKELIDGTYYKKGDSIYVKPINKEEVIRIDFDFEEIEKISVLNSETFKEEKELDSLQIFSILDFEKKTSISNYFSKKTLFIDDEIDILDEVFADWISLLKNTKKTAKNISFTTFNEDEKSHIHVHFLSVLKYRSGYDLANDLRDKIKNKWKTLVFTKKIEDVKALLLDQKVPFLEGINSKNCNKSSIFLIETKKEDIFPQSFQSPSEKVLVITDTDIVIFNDNKKAKNDNIIFNDFLSGLKVGDYVVHNDHGIAKFQGLTKKTVENVKKEYLKLAYAENDKLFVPIDQADKVNKYIGSEETMPKLTRLGSADWSTLTNKVRKETEAIAKELLKLYAERKTATGHKYNTDTDRQIKFEATFQYKETPGQIKAINDVKRDMEKDEAMDRLICGDVGFGKTEVAMRAAFKAVDNGKQVAVIAPITILADQHYKSFKKRMESFNVRVEMLSRFRTQKEQKIILEKLKKGEIDIIIGTHRLIQKDIKFKNLGLVIIDEEQRFGVKQKEKLKEIRKEVDILTLTATPIPRTLNLALNKLRDITTITTPPFGRLPVITEVRKYSPKLVREAILKEINRGGQVYMLHNRVQTIDSFADKLKELVPEAKFIVAHGKLGSGDLEERIMAFKNGEFNVLVSSTIIENGIDLENANTLIINNAERFGLSQLYQLRGRVGRGKTQAYAYFLYHGQRLKLDAKKRLRAIVEASDLGSGFQIAMKDLEIRGAGDILGANQHGVINVVGVSHFMRMLNRAVEDLKAGKVIKGNEEIKNVSIELPIQGFIPDTYIVSSKDKINAYQKLSSADTFEYLKEIEDGFIADYGKEPEEVKNLIKIIKIKILAKKAGILNVKAETVPMSKEKDIVMHMSGHVKPVNLMSLLEYNNSWLISGTKLRINMKDLGSNWIEELQKCLKALGKTIKHGI